MKKAAVLIMKGLLIGLVLTVASVHSNGAKEIHTIKNCGYSVNSKTQQRTTLHGCLLNTYGWPATFVTSRVEVIDRDYTTKVFPNDPTNAGSVIAFTSFSYGAFIADWAAFAALSTAIIAVLNQVCGSKQATPKRSAKR